MHTYSKLLSLSTLGVYTVSTHAGNEKTKITQRGVNTALPPFQGQRFIRDVALPGFALRITSQGTKAFIVEKRSRGKLIRRTLGKSHELTVTQARSKAQALIGRIAEGKDLDLANDPAHAEKSWHLEDVFANFLDTRRELKAHTVYDYTRIIHVAFGDWKRLSITEISRQMVLSRHRELGTFRGNAYANLAMRVLRSILNFAKASLTTGTGVPVLPENPVTVLTDSRAWFRTTRRTRIIRSHELPTWFRAVQEIRRSTNSQFAQSVGDLLIFLLFTGLRRGEATHLTWSDVDFDDRSITLSDTKNRDPHSLPMPRYIENLLRERKASSRSLLVFPGRSPDKPIVEPKRVLRALEAKSGVLFTIHDLRRTFATIAECVGVSGYLLKRMLNHKLSGDVTGGYLNLGVEHLRDPMERIAKEILSIAKVSDLIS